MARQIKKTYRFILWFFATLVAGGSLAGCGMYGPPPRSYYTMNGRVVQENGEGIFNIKVTISETKDSVYTSKDGTFSIVNQDLMGRDNITLEVEDLDGEENGGEFKSQRIKLNNFRNQEISIEMENKDEL